jgi:LuxR family maltose regulon positive regulatory protein
MHADAARAVEAGTGSGPWHANSLLLLGVAELLRGSPGPADELFTEAIAAAPVEDAPDLHALAFAERSLVAAAAGETEAAENDALRAHRIVREAELERYPTSALVHAAEAGAALRKGDRIEAARELERAHILLPRLAAIPWLAAQTGLELARVHLALREHAEVEALLAGVEDVLRGVPDLGAISVELARLHEQLELAREPESGWPAGLTRAERRLLPLLATHLTFREIAAELDISRNTVKTQAISVYRKLRVSSRAEAIDAAVDLELLVGPGSPHLAVAPERPR